MTGQLLGLGLLTTAGLLVLWARRSRGGSGRCTPVAQLGPNHALFVVEIEGRRLLVGVGPQAAPAMLAALDAPDARHVPVDPVPRPRPVREAS